MKKTIVILLILILIIITNITKNSSKNLENEIYNTKENISVLQNEYELILLDYNFLTSPKKLLEYQAKYFESDLVPIDYTEFLEIKEEYGNFIIKKK